MTKKTQKKKQTQLTEITQIGHIIHIGNGFLWGNLGLFRMFEFLVNHIDHKHTKKKKKKRKEHNMRSIVKTGRPHEKVWREHTKGSSCFLPW